MNRLDLHAGDLLVSRVAYLKNKDGNYHAIVAQVIWLDVREEKNETSARREALYRVRTPLGDIELAEWQLDRDWKKLEVAKDA